MKAETVIKLNKFKPRPYQVPMIDALENKGYKRVLAILPRRAGKDVTAFNYMIRCCIKTPGVYYYIFPTYSQAKKVIWDSMTNDGFRILDFVPDELVESKNGQEMKIRFKNGSLMQLVGSDRYDCFDDETEILTENGWKLFVNLLEGERVAALNNGTLVYEEPTQRVEYEYDGLLYGAENSSINFWVTPNHRKFVVSKKGFSKFKQISDPTIIADRIPATCKWKGSSPLDILGYPPAFFVAFLGIYLAEGSCFSNHKCYRVTISQTKENVRHEIRELLCHMGLNFVEHKIGFNIENKELYEYVSQFGLQGVRFIPKDIKNLNRRLLKILFRWLVLGDGHECKTYTGYYSTSKRLIGDVQEIAIKMGFSGNVSEKKQTCSFIKGRKISSFSTLYQFFIRKSKYKQLCGANFRGYIKTKPYKGKVFCVSVPSGVVKVRREGKEIWSGNSLMGTNPRGCIFSEYALQDPRAYQYIRPILTANNGWALFISTPRGKNHLWALYQIALHSKEWFCLKLTVEETKHISLHEIMKEKAEGIMSDDLIQQEYYTSFTMGVEGAYYMKYVDAARREGRVGMVLHEAGFKVHTAWDIGVRDSTTIIFFQTIGQTVRIIDCYSNSKEGLEHYVSVLKEKPYVYGIHVAPHDIKVREWGSGITRIEKAAALGVKFTLSGDYTIMDGIESVRSLFSKLWIDETKCVELLQSLENYRQEYDSKRKIYKPTPLHDSNSHYADSMRYLAVSLPKTRDGLTGQDLDKLYNEALLGENANVPEIFRGHYDTNQWTIDSF